MIKNNLVKKVLSGAKNFAFGATLFALPFLYSGNSNAQKAEEAQEFGTAVVGGIPAKVSLSEYIGTSFLSVPTDDKTNELGREFYPFLTLRGKDEKGKDTTNIVSWKTRDGKMEDLKSDVVYVPKKVDGKYLIKLKNDGVLGIKPTDSKISKDADAISGKTNYESGKVEDVIRTVKFPNENQKYYLFYRDHNVDSTGVQNGKKTSFAFVKACEGKEPIYSLNDEVYFEGEIFEFIATDKSNLKKIVDAEGKSLIYSEKYLEENKNEIDGIRASDKTLANEQKRGIPGHVKEFLQEGKPCEEQKSSKEKTPLNMNGRIKLGAGYTIPNGYVLELNPQVQLGEKSFLGPYFSLSNSTRSLEKITKEDGFRQVVSVPAQMYFVNTGSEIKENTKITNNLGLGLNFSYKLSENIEAFVKAGLLGQKIEKTMTSAGEEYMEIAGVKDQASAQSYNETNTSITNNSLFEGSQVYIGAGAEYFPLKGRSLKALDNLSVYGEAGYIIDSGAMGSVGIKYNLSKSKNKSTEGTK